jgi:hypothetical protein
MDDRRGRVVREVAGGTEPLADVVDATEPRRTIVGRLHGHSSAAAR